MYHGVRTGQLRINGRHITAKHFEKQLQYFKRKFSVVPLDQLCEMKFAGVVPEKHAIALTFDDGFVNNLTVALPLLEKYGLPATFFICTAAISDPNYAHPTDRVDLVRVSAAPGVIKLNGEEFFRKAHHVVGADNEHAYSYLNHLPYSQWLKANNDLASQLNDKNVTEYAEVYALLNDQQVSAFVRSNLVKAASHSHHHIRFTSLSHAEADFQLKESKAILETYDKAVNAIAFPYGDYDGATIAAARKHGYRYLIAGGHVDPPFDNDVFPRIGVLDGAGFSYTMLMISNAFKRFGF